jgi:hypothetical protein
MFWEASTASQKPGAAIFDSISWIDSRLVSTSKGPPEFDDALFQVLHAGYFFAVHT